MDLADVALFRAIAAVGSLSAAARQMGTTPMLVSRRLAGLEAELGARLFHRTTRSLSLTPEGEAFLPHAVTLMEARDSAFDSVSSGGSGLSGVLKMTAPNVIGHSVVVPVVATLIADNPALRVDLTLSDSVIDIATAGLDVAVRVAEMKPSDMIATRVADNPFTLIASPGYVARFGQPVTTEDLVSHPCIKLHAMDTWPFTRGGEMHRVRIGGPFSASTVDAVRAACIAGVGIAMLTYWDVHEQVARGELQRIALSDVEPREVGIWAVFPTRAHMPARVRAFIDALREHCSAGSSVPLSE
ncbi:MULTISPECIES: LysR family transcriptional regulator [Rhodopseudomonas]|uniref:LysR family transcriptional regulator n=1 Tax=Rhodopseudomonas palustris TaxID=1076 RepID=A0A0D7EEV0_RHOPL|nr:MULTISPECIES: LysR family transcriptional regulator [Rhodopseudomonas]KIZ39243.1 LysR family transcriptional regulator [Rhodopseudomonas palustris]MDF3814343.1 LysR family transcriptional regulator [Rhodopseudomonas sp. BAL398]WOK18039.1 LysR family transcriptional regulator [Rhodopseudomonas sp. BAL398]